MKKILTFVIVFIAVSACKKADNEPTNTDGLASGSDQLILVANEGPFQSGTGTISRINISTGTAEQEVFQNTNGFPLGNIVLSTHVYNDKIYLIVNNAQKVEVANYPEFTSTGLIDGFGQPRYMVTHNGMGYVSDYTADGVHVVDLESNSITSIISTGLGPNDLLIHGEKMFVANSGGFGTDNRISVIDLGTSSVTSQIEVTDIPYSLEIDGQGDLRVMCRGVGSWPDPENESAGALVTIDMENLTVTQTLNFDTQEHPVKLVADNSGQYLFYLLDGNIYRIDASATELPENPLVVGNFYSLASHPEAQNLIATDAMDYQSDGKVYLFDWDGNQEAVFDAGVIPSHVLPL